MRDSVYVVECNVNCHKKCQKFIPNLCGVNQKILAEQLSSIRLSQSSPKSPEPVSMCFDFQIINNKRFCVQCLRQVNVQSTYYSLSVLFYDGMPRYGVPARFLRCCENQPRRSASVLVLDMRTGNFLFSRKHCSFHLSV